MKQKVKYISILPSLVTLMNALGGFAAIVYIMKPVDIEILLFKRLSVPSLAVSGYLICLAMVADMLDGWLARMTDTASDFGANLDSLCDAVSFGAAPAYLLLKLEEAPIKALPPGLLAYVAGKGIFIIAVIYLGCALIRLARFNTESIAPAPPPTQIAAAAALPRRHEDFAGLPSPAAAGIIAGIVVFRESFLPKLAHWPAFYAALNQGIIFALPWITLAASFLMVSRVRYTHLMNTVMESRKTPLFFALIFLALLLAIFHIEIVLVLGFVGYALTGVLCDLWAMLKKDQAPEV